MHGCYEEARHDLPVRGSEEEGESEERSYFLLLFHQHFINIFVNVIILTICKVKINEQKP